MLQQLYVRLSELIGLNDHLLLLDFFVRKIATNLKCYTEVVFSVFGLLLPLFLGFFFSASHFVLLSQSEEVIDQTLSLFLELASGFVCLFSIYKMLLVKYYSSFKHIYFVFLQLYDWKATTQVGHSQVHCSPSHRIASLFCLLTNFLAMPFFFLIPSLTTSVVHF